MPKPLSPSEVSARLPLVVALLAAWSQGDSDLADESQQALAILMVENLSRHMLAGSLPLEDAEEFSGSLADAGAALGQVPQPIAPTCAPPPAPTLPDLGAPS